MEAGSNKLEVLQSMGDWLDSITESVGQVWEKNNAGFNMVDKMRWSRYRDHESAASSILFKYRRQLQSKYGDSIGDVTKCFTEFKTKPFVYPLIKKNQWGPLVAFKVFKMPPEYFDKYRITCKSAGMWWDGIEKCWFVPSKSLHGFDFKSLMIAITDIGFEFMPFERGELEEAIVVAAPKKEMTLPEAVEAHSRGYLRDTVIVRHRPDSKFEILFPYSPALNDLFSNKSGKLSGITEFNENSKGRETYQIELVLEAIEKIKAIVPNWKLMLSGVDEAKAAWDKRKSELEQQIPEVQSIIAQGFMLYPHQNEGVKAFLKNNGCFLLGDEVGCIDGDAIIAVNRGGASRRIKLKELYFKFNGGIGSHGKKWNLSTPTKVSSVNNDGGLVLNEVKKVIYSGKKECLKLTVRSSAKIYKVVCTPDHEILTNRGWVEARNLLSSDLIATNGVKFCFVCKKDTVHASYEYSKFKGQCRVCIYRIKRKNSIKTGEVFNARDGYTYVTGMHNHPRQYSGRLVKHVLVAEARLNNFSYSSYLKKIKKNDLEKIKFISRDMHVHHIDENRQNNSPRNLVMLTESEHNKEHKKIQNIKGMRIHFGKIVEIKSAGVVETYDIVMNDPYRNFIANGIVVHNCGKSLQSLSFVAGYGHRALVVAPKVVRRQWIDEAKKFFPNYFTEFNSLELTSKTFKKYEDLSGMSIVSVNYESLEKWWPRIKAAGFDTILIDESHKIKSEKTKTAKMMTGVSPYFKNRILMSGTMIKNKRDELFTQVNIVAPGLFADKEEIRKMSIGAVWNKMQGIYLARRKIDVLKDLPELTTQIALIEYKGIPDFDLNFGISFEEISAFKAVVAKAKAPVSVEFIRDLLDNSESSMIVFTDSVEAAKEIHTELGDDAVLHHGQMSDDSREKVKKDWQSLKIKSRVFVTTRQSLPAGATLTRADKVIFNDLPWTAADIIQATARAHRIGTKNAVNAYWVTVQGNNWDEKLTNIAKRKYDICKKVNEGKQVTAEERAWMNNPVGVQDLLKEVINKKESF